MSKRRGRPPLFPRETPARVQVTLSPSAYDCAKARARERGVSIPAVLRRVLDAELAAETRDRQRGEE